MSWMVDVGDDDGRIEDADGDGDEDEDEDEDELRAAVGVGIDSWGAAMVMSSTIVRSLQAVVVLYMVDGWV
jgi:hypothetical protein